MFTAPSFRFLIDLIPQPGRLVQRPSLLQEYLELHTYAGLLTESARVDFIVKTYGAKLEAKWEATGGGEPAPVVAAIEAEQGDTPVQKLISYFANIDPSPNQGFLQWLVVRYLTDRFRLEDGPATRQVLIDFNTMRPRLPADKRDINRFPTVGDVRAVLSSQLQQDIPAADPVLDAQMRKEAELVYNGPDVTIIIPKTEEASCYFGKGTEWCTAKYKPGDYRNMFKHYPSLYIVFDKKTGKRVQLHFSSRQFMDENDVPINLREYLEAHPSVFKAIGEDKFIPVAEDIGLHWFSPDTMAMFDPGKLAAMIHTPEDYARIPPNVAQDRDFMGQLLMRNPQAVAWLPRSIIQDESWLERYVQTLPQIFRFLPEDLQNEHLAEIAATHSRGWQQIQQNIPEKWMTPEVYQQMWNDRISRDTRLRLSDVPQEYWSPKVVFETLARNPDDIPNHTDLLDRDIAHKIAQKNIAALKTLPPEYLDDTMAQLVEQQARRHSYPNPYEYILRFPSQYWTEPATQYLVNSGLEFPYTHIPERLRTPKLTEEYLLHHSATAATVPPEYYTDEVLVDALSHGYQSTRLVKTLDPRLLTDEVLDGVVGKFQAATNLPSLNSLYEELPPALRRPNVRRSFMRVGAVPVNEMPANATTEEALLQRAGHNPAETNEIPQAFWTPDLAVKLASKNLETLPKIPDAMLSEPLLWVFLQPEDLRTHYNRFNRVNALKDQIERFPENLWSSRTYAAAVDRHFLPPEAEQVPPHLMDSQVAGAILGREASQIDKLPSNLVNDETLSKAVKRNIDILQVIKPDDITEPVAFAAMDTWAKLARPTRYHHGEEYAPKLLGIPRDVWSKRVYQDAVGNIVNLKEVPSQFRDDAMIRDAIMRDPSNVRFISHPADWLNKNLKDITIDDQWRATLEASGVIPMKKGGYKSVEDLKKIELPSGYMAAVLPLGSVNKRCYLFDPKGQFICYLYTDKKKVWFPDAEKYREYQEPLKELAEEYLPVSNFESWQLNLAGIYKGNRGWISEEQAKREEDGVFAWSHINHLDGKMYVAWFNDKPIIRCFMESRSGGFGRSNTLRPASFDVYDWPIALAHVPDLLHFGKRWLQIDWKWQPLGVLAAPRGGNVYNVGERQIGKVGDYSVKTDGKYVGIFGPEGMIAFGKYIKRSATIERIERVGHGPISEPIMKAFDRIGAYISKGKDLLSKEDLT